MAIRTAIIILFLAFILVACSSATETDIETEPTVDSGDAQSVDVAVQATDEATVVPVVEEPTIEPPTIVAPTDINLSNPPTFAPTAEPLPTSVPATVDTSSSNAAANSGYNGPSWANITLVNAATGEEFTLADFEGRTVFVEPMATWCTNCFAQQTRVSQAMNQLDLDDFVFISLSVGENVSNETLAAYADRNGFQQVFVVGTDEFVSALVNEYGFTVTTPPSTPHFLISPSGTISELNTGSHSIEQIIEDVMNAQAS
ncbi:MAG: SCO family protein [Chloroflexota bacterium]